MLEQDPFGRDGTAEACREFMDGQGSERGWCLGDAHTQPEAGAFDTSPFAEGRGYDFITPRDSMRIVYTTTHGTPAGNENLDGDAILEAVEAAVAEARGE